MIKRLIFDVDGTLITGVSFIPAIENTFKRISHFREENIQKFCDAIATYESEYNHYSELDYLNHLSKNLENICFNKKFLEIFFDELRMCVPPKNIKLIESITRLSQVYELVLLTNYFRKSQMNRLNEMKIGHLFLDCFGEEIIKPNKEAYLQACGKHLPSECVMIGDNIDLDIRAAKEVGLNTILVGPYKILNSNEADVVVNLVEEMNSSLIKNIELKRNL